eukprot:TRINITY_DN1496_c0_g1_i3.p1 TRINITY_DN1496_c0_g1~~TRINITY_DN1496_c0_g1_i3.p1  ORF type:complete len:505 (-),score=78.87 TRINITY_DN1496_c0_g1_i3:966-2480(-)
MGDERSFEKQATAALRRRVELRGLKDSAKAARPCREPLSKRSRAPCVVSSSAASDDEEQEEEEEEEEEEGDYNGDEDANPEADLEDVTRSFHIFPRDESKADCDSESKLVYQSSVPSSPSQFLLEDMDTLSVDSSLVSYNSEEENALGMGLDSDLARERSTVSFASDSSSLCVGNNSASDDTPTPTDTSTANVSDLEIIGLEGSQSATISRETVAEDSISEPSFPVALQAQSVSEKVSSVGGAARDAIFLSSSQGPCISASQRISSFIHSIKTPPWAYISIAGRRPEMEDAVAAVPGFYSLPSKSLQGCPPNLTDAEKIHEGCAMHFFGVYDGHGGAQASNYCKVRLHQALAEELETAFGEASKENMSTEEWKHKWERALVDSFKKVDAEVGQEPSRREDGEEDSGLGCCTEPVAPETVGTTAVVAVVGACHVIVANCGDSRAVLCRAGRAIPLSEDHKVILQSFELLLSLFVFWAMSPLKPSLCSFSLRERTKRQELKPPAAK